MRLKSTIARSNKNKGRTGQQEVRDYLLLMFPTLERDDVRSNPMGAPGEDLLLSPAARALFPYQIEVKRKIAIGACRFMEQAAEHGKHEPIAIFREDRGEWLAMLSLKTFVELQLAANKTRRTE